MAVRHRSFFGPFFALALAVCCAATPVHLFAQVSAQDKGSEEQEKEKPAPQEPWENKPAPQLPPEVVTPDTQDEDLALLLIPLSREQLGAAAEKWFKLYQQQTTDLINVQVGINAAERAGDLERATEQRVQLEKVTAERAEIGRKFATVLDSWEDKGGNTDDIKKYRDYRTAIVKEQTLSADLSTLWGYAKSSFLTNGAGLNLLIKLAIFIAGTFILLLLARHFSNLSRKAAERMPQVSHLLENFIHFVAYWIFLAFGLLTLLALIGINVSPLLALMGGVSFVLAFAMQSTLGNVASGLMIMLNRPFDEGDFVDVGGVLGTVKAVKLMTTCVITPDNQTVLIPNANVWGDVITNSHTSSHIIRRRVDLTFGISYRDDIQAAQRILEEVVHNYPRVLKTPATDIRVAELADNSVNFNVRPWVVGTDYWDTYWDLTRLVKEAFDANGISIPFPQREIHVCYDNASSEPDRAPAKLPPEPGQAARAQDKPPLTPEQKSPGSDEAGGPEGDDNGPSG